MDGQEETEARTAQVLKMIDEAWRLRLGMEQARMQLAGSEAQKRADHATARFDKQFWQAAGAYGLEVYGCRGEFSMQPFDERLPLDAINLMDFEPDEVLVAEQVLKPIIKWKGSPDVLQRGTVVLRSVGRRCPAAPEAKSESVPESVPESAKKSVLGSALGSLVGSVFGKAEESAAGSGDGNATGSASEEKKE